MENPNEHKFQRKIILRNLINFFKFIFGVFKITECMVFPKLHLIQLMRFYRTPYMPTKTLGILAEKSGNFHYLMHDTRQRNWYGKRRSLTSGALDVLVSTLLWYMLDSDRLRFEIVQFEIQIVFVSGKHEFSFTIISLVKPERWLS